MTTPNIKSPAVPFGSLIVISGATGFIGSHVVDQALAAGYRVRGTTRDVEKAAWEVEHFEKKYGADKFELVAVPDMGVETAFDEAVKGASGFIHLAHDMAWVQDPKVHIPGTVNGAINALKAADKAGIKRFVYISSSRAISLPIANVEMTVTEHTYNETALKQAWEPNPPPFTIYGAAKLEAERALVKWAKETSPDMVVNILCPNNNLGLVISSVHQGYPTSASLVPAVWKSELGGMLKNWPPQQWVNVQDDAKLHIIALANPDVRFERIFPMAGPYAMNDIIDIMRKLYPKKEWKPEPDVGRDIRIIEPRQRAEDLLKEAYGSGWIGLEETVKANAADLSD